MKNCGDCKFHKDGLAGKMFCISLNKEILHKEKHSCPRWVKGKRNG